MPVLDPDVRASAIAAAIGEPARARMLYSLVDGRARTSTELAVVAGVTPSTASAHLLRLKNERLVKVFAQGKHRYYSLEGLEVAAVLEALNVAAGGSGDRLAPRTPPALRSARTCYDHIAGALGVALTTRFLAMEWLSGPASDSTAYELTAAGEAGFHALGVDVESVKLLRRRFAFACVDWSERRPHLGGALGAAFLKLALRKRWVTQELDSRALTVTPAGRRDFQSRFGLALESTPAGPRRVEAAVFARR